jgi:hypothetical protein
MAALKLWACGCYIHWRERAAEWVYANVDGCTLREVGRLMHEHVAADGEIDEVRETRPEWRDEFEFHHDLRFTLPDGGRVYIETVLEMGRDPEDATINVVNIHDA